MWNVVRVAYFDSDTADLLLESVQSIVKEIKRIYSKRVFINAHWKFGPHIDIAIDCTEKTFLDEVFPYAKKCLDEWLKESPSLTVIEPNKYEQLSKRLAISELEPPPYLPLLDNNQVTIAEYEVRKAIDILDFHKTKEEFLIESCDLLFHLVDLKKNDNELFFQVLIFMMSISANQFMPNGISRGYISFRSHAEYFFENYDKDNALKKKISVLGEKYSSLIDRNLLHVSEGNLDKIDLPDSAKEILYKWAIVIGDSYQSNLKVVENVYSEIVDKEESFFSNDKHFSNLAKSISENLDEDDPLRKKYYTTGKVVDSALQHEQGRELFSSKEFITYRTTINYFYLLLPVLGVTPIQKYSLCDIVSNSVERVYKISWKDIIPN